MNSIIYRLIVALIILVAATADYEAIESPRKQLAAILKANGCTNRVVQHYVIDAYTSGISAPVLINRLQGVTTYPTNLITKW